MTDGASQPEQESVPQRKAASSDPDPTGFPDGSQEHDAILRRYGEAMLRIGQLESQVDGRGLQRPEEAIHTGGDSEAPLRQRSLEYRSLLARIEALESSVGISPGDEPERRSGGPTDQGPPVDTPAQGPHSDQAANLRVQISGLNAKLAQTEAELKELRAPRTRRRSRSERDRPKSKWKFWGR